MFPGKLIKRIPGSHLLISTMFTRQGFENANVESLGIPSRQAAMFRHFSQVTIMYIFIKVFQHVLNIVTQLKLLHLHSLVYG